MHLLPARFDDARDVAAQGEQAETDAAQVELAEEAPRTTTLVTPIAVPHAPLRRFPVGGHIDGLCHCLVPERHSEMFQERAPLLIIRSGGVEGDVHPLRLVELLEVDLREDDLFANAHRVVAAPVE